MAAALGFATSFLVLRGSDLTRLMVTLGVALVCFELANKFAAEHPGLLARYLTHTFGIDDVQAAFELAGRPDSGRGKIAIVAS